MGKALRCDNPNCRKFFDVNDLEQKWSEISVFYKKGYSQKQYSDITTNTITINNNLIYSNPEYILCAECTKKLNQLIGNN